MAPLPLSQPIVAHESCDPTVPTVSTTTSPRPSKKRKRKDQPHILHASTLRQPLYTYFHLSLQIPSQPGIQTTMEPLTVSQLLTQALSSYFGLTGAAIPVDILKTEGRDVWIRCPRRDRRVVQAGLAGWIGKVGGEKCGWRVIGEGMGCLGRGDGNDIFGD